MASSPYKSAKEISEGINVSYKHTFKILKEFLDEGIVLEKDRKYYIKSDFIVHFKKMSDMIVNNYSKELIFKNKFDLYNVLSSTYADEKITNQVYKLMDD